MKRKEMSKEARNELKKRRNDQMKRTNKKRMFENLVSNEIQVA